MAWVRAWPSRLVTTTDTFCPPSMGTFTLKSAASRGGSKFVDGWTGLPSTRTRTEAIGLRPSAATWARNVKPSAGTGIGASMGRGAFAESVITGGAWAATSAAGSGFWFCTSPNACAGLSPSMRAASTSGRRNSFSNVSGREPIGGPIEGRPVAVPAEILSISHDGRFVVAFGGPDYPLSILADEERQAGRITAAGSEVHLLSPSTHAKLDADARRDGIECGEVAERVLLLPPDGKNLDDITHFQAHIIGETPNGDRRDFDSAVVSPAKSRAQSGELVAVRERPDADRLIGRAGGQPHAVGR